MDLRQFLIAPHERPGQQPARHATAAPQHQYQQSTITVDPRQAQHAPTTPSILLRHDQPVVPTTHLRTGMDNPNGRFQHLQQQQQQREPQDQKLSREQVVNGLTAYPDIVAAILRSGHIPNQAQSDLKASRQHSNTLLTAPPSSCMSSAQQINKNPFAESAIPSSPAPPTKSPRSSTRLCFWYYHQGNCTNNPSSPTYDGSSRSCPFVHSAEGMQEFKVQPGKESWHIQLGDCGLELCKFSSNYKYKDELEVKEQRKKSFREGEKERKKEKRRSGIVEGVDGKDGDRHSEPRAEHQYVMGTSYQSFLLLQEQNTPDTAPVNSNSTTPAIPTSPRAGRYAKGSRFQQASVSSATPTPSTLKRKASAASSQITPTPASKKVKTSASVPSSQTDSQSASTIPLSKHAARRLKRTKASRPLTTGTSTLSTTPKPLDIIPYITNHTHPSISRSDHSKPHHQTCFAWYHDECPYSGKAGKKGKKCAELHALTDPPSFVVVPEGYVHKGGICGRDWCGGDWRPEEDENEDEDEIEDSDGEVEGERDDHETDNRDEERMEDCDDENEEGSHWP